jgi:hypothetical protein
VLCVVDWVRRREPAPSLEPRPSAVHEAPAAVPA